MPDYELIREIPNLCRNNQMRDVLFEEVSCEDPEQWVRAQLPDLRQLTSQIRADGSVIFFAETAELVQKFHFTPL